MIREVDLTSYLPLFMQEYVEPVATLDAENPEFHLVWAATDWVQRNRFVETADEYGISRFEKIIGIVPSEQDTLESRRMRVRNKWLNHTPYTIQILTERLMALCGSDGFSLNYNFEQNYTLKIETGLAAEGLMREINEIINTFVPCNVNVDYNNQLSFEITGDTYIASGITQTQIIEVTN